MSKKMSPAKKFGSKLKAIKETLESEGKTPMKTQRMVDRIMSEKKAHYEKKKYLTGGQAKIAAKAPPRNKIDAKDFAVLRAEKAKGRGMGLQDEKVKPGKVMKAKRGKSIQGTTAKSAAGKSFQGYHKVFETGADRSTPKSQRGVSTIVGVKPNPKKSVAKTKRVTYKSMDEMRQKTLGYRKGESTAEFKARKANEDFARRATRATGIRGKVALGVAAAGIGAYQYLKSKMKKKKEEPKKKMGGGMMKRPMGYKKGKEIDYGKIFDKKFYKSALGKEAQLHADDYDAGLDRAERRAASETMALMKKNKKMGGGMMKVPGYASGASEGGVKPKIYYSDRKGNTLVIKDGKIVLTDPKSRGKTDPIKRSGRPAAAPPPPRKKRIPQGPKKAGLGTGLGALGGSRAGRGSGKEDSSVTLGKFMKAKTDALNESVKAGGMKRERILQGSNMRRPEAFVKDVEAGKYSKPTKDASYYKSIGLTGKRGDQAVKDFFKPADIRMKNIMAGKYMGGGMMNKPMGYKSGKSIKVKCKLGKNKPTKMY